MQQVQSPVHQCRAPLYLFKICFTMSIHANRYNAETIDLDHCAVQQMGNRLMLVQALKSSSDEFARILDIVSRYAVYKAGVAFSCKRQVLLCFCHVERTLDDLT